MEIEIRAYEEKELPAMIQIWNEIVETGIAFPQEEILTLQTGKQFFDSQTSTQIPERSAVCIFCIPTTWDGAATSATPALPFIRKRAGCISVKNWSPTV